MEVVQAEVWKPDVVISGWGWDLWDGGVGCKTPGYWELCDGSRSLVPAEESGWMVWFWLPEWFPTCPDFSFLFCACARSCARDPSLDFYSPWLGMRFISCFCFYLCLPLNRFIVCFICFCFYPCLLPNRLIVCFICFCFYPCLPPNRFIVWFICFCFYPCWPPNRFIVFFICFPVFLKFISLDSPFSYSFLACNWLDHFVLKI